MHNINSLYSNSALNTKAKCGIIPKFTILSLTNPILLLTGREYPSITGKYKRKKTNPANAPAQHSWLLQLQLPIQGSALNT